MTNFPNYNKTACIDQRLAVGDDIVDLDVITPAPHKRFLARVFTPAERENIGSSWSSLWLHWAVKEAAFKAFSRLVPDLVFAPQRFEVDLERSEVQTPVGTAYFESLISDEFVYAFCTTVGSKELPAILSWIEKSRIGEEEEQSAMVRALARRSIAGILSIPTSAISILCEPRGVWSRMPSIQVKGRAPNSLVSFSHHGRFVSCAYRPTEYSDLSQMAG